MDATVDSTEATAGATSMTSSPYFAQRCASSAFSSALNFLLSALNPPPSQHTHTTFHRLHPSSLFQDDALGHKEAHLKMLRSRLEMADRDAEAMRRKLEAANARQLASGTSAGGAFGAGGGGGGGNGGGYSNGNGGFGGGGGNYQPPPPGPMEVSNAAALTAGTTCDHS